MSIEAIRYVLKLDLAKSSDKFILFCIANYADERGFAYPSIERLVRDTSLNRKTVMKSIASLEASSLLLDTGRRIGATARVPIYAITGMPTESKLHYTYRVSNTDTGEFYVGKRSFQGDPETDSYRGSGAWVKKVQAEGVLLIREVLKVWRTDEEASAHEQQLMREHEENPLCKNQGTPLAFKRRYQESLSKVPNTGSLDLPVIVPVLDGNGTDLGTLNSPNLGTQNHQVTITKPKIEKAPSPAKPKKPGTRKTELTLPDWAKSQPAGQELIGPEHPARVFASKAGIPDGWVALAWKAFADKHLTSGKTYKDWGQAFRNAVAGNWENVWYMHKDGQWMLTTVGHGLDRVVNGGDV